MSEKFNILKGAGDTQRGNLVSLETGDIGAFKNNPALLGLIKAVYTIQQTGFAGAVGPDNRKYLPFFHSGGDARKGFQPAETQMNIFDNKLVWVSPIHSKLSPIAPPA
jgi:hypothetical protein